MTIDMTQLDTKIARILHESREVELYEMTYEKVDSLNYGWISHLVEPDDEIQPYYIYVLEGELIDSFEDDQIGEFNE